MTLRKYLVLLAVVVFGATGDSFLARGMKDVGTIDIHHLSHVFTALANPWVLLGIFSLLAFMSIPVRTYTRVSHSGCELSLPFTTSK